MKKFLALLSFCFICFISCNNGKSPELENRLTAIEKSLAIKDAQITGLSELAYIHSLDSLSMENDSFNLASITFKAFQLQSPATCRATCARKLATHLNICHHVAPGNYSWCISTAFRNYMTCLGNCH